MRGGWRAATFFCSSRTPSWRACLRSWPEESSRRCSMRLCSHSTAAKNPGTELVHDGEPRHAEEQRHTREPHTQQQQRGAKEAQACRRAAAGKFAQHTAGAIAAARSRSNAGSPRPQLVTKVSTNPVARSSVLMSRARIRQRLIHVHQPAGVSQHHGKEVRRAAEQKQERIRRARRRPDRSNCRPGPGSPVSAKPGS